MQLNYDAFKKYFPASVAGLVVGAITTIAVFVPQIGTLMSSATVSYCEAPVEKRAELRAEVNGDIAPHKIVLVCQGDDVSEVVKSLMETAAVKDIPTVTEITNAIAQ